MTSFPHPPYCPRIGIVNRGGVVRLMWPPRLLKVMKLDRNINPDGRGKYALLKLRRQPKGFPVELQHCAQMLKVAGLLDFGGTPETDFFVIRLKDKYAGPALHAYAEAAKPDDMEYAAEIDALAQAADRYLPKRIPD